MLQLLDVRYQAYIHNNFNKNFDSLNITKLTARMFRSVSKSIIQHCTKDLPARERKHPVKR